MFGTSPGRGGQVLKTPLGDIPVYNNVREGLDAGHRFNTGVVYLPPSGVRDGVAELIRVNPELRKIVIVTEKISVHDAREIRAMASSNGVDIFGGNCLGVADSWNQVRIGGALGGDNPDETLLQGLGRDLLQLRQLHHHDRAATCATGGLGHDDARSRRGKDVYIHFAAPRLRPRASTTTRAARRRCCMSSPAATTSATSTSTSRSSPASSGAGRRKLTRAVGHAGAMAGGGDDAEDKERWFMEKFGVDAHLHAGEPGAARRKGAVVTNIAHIPAALTAVMALNGVEPDFAPRGQPVAEALVRPTIRVSRCRPSSICRWSRRRRPTTRRSPALQPAGRRGVPAPDDEGRARARR